MISLWQCWNAIYKENDYLKCSKGYNLGPVHARMVKKGNPLFCMICQSCADYDKMGEHIPKSERGWK